jgi:hypothetical protein
MENSRLIRDIYGDPGDRNLRNNIVPGQDEGLERARDLTDRPSLETIMEVMNMPNSPYEQDYGKMDAGFPFD